MTTEPLYADPAFARLYDHQCPWSPDAEYCLQLALNAASVLDIGCGTGRFCTTLAAHGPREICGVDPAPGMLSIARARPSSHAVEWVAADARDVRIGRRFDLIVMTGHAFQTLLTDIDRAATFATIAAHLAPNGRFIFDSRNPIARAWARWTPDLSRETFAHPDLGPVTSWVDTLWDDATSIATYTMFYDIAHEGRTIHATSRIAFPPQETLAAQMADAGLRVDAWMGEWDGRGFTHDAPEIIPLGSLNTVPCQPSAALPIN